MARRKSDAKLDTRTARAKLPQRREPYWTSLTAGLALGYRKGAKGGHWVAKHYSAEHGRRYGALGPADDTLEERSRLNVFSEIAMGVMRSRGKFADLKQNLASQMSPLAKAIVKESSVGQIGDAEWGAPLSPARGVLVAFLASLRNAGGFDAVAVDAVPAPLRARFGVVN